MNLPQIAQAVDASAMAFVFGATAWFFFVQSPVLLKKLGREKFVPIQMRLTLVLFKVLTALLLLAAAATALHSPFASAAMISALVALVGVGVNQFFMVPRALKAGGRSRKDIKGMDHEGSTSGFASEGAGNQTRLYHRLVVLFVVVMLGGVVGHGLTLLAA